MATRPRAKGKGTAAGTASRNGAFAVPPGPAARFVHGERSTSGPTRSEEDQEAVRGSVSLASVEIQAVEVASGNVRDGPMLTALPEQTGPDHGIVTVTAEVPADAPPVRAALAMPMIRAPATTQSRLPVPPRFVGQRVPGPFAGPPRLNSAAAQGHGNRTPPEPGAWNETSRASKRLGRALRRSRSGHHRRNRAETKATCVKLLGQRLMAARCLAFVRRVAELRIRAAVPGRVTALGIPVTIAAG